jgi:hypothetical protein
MGDEMSRAAWWIAGRVSRLLCAQDRTMAMGDLTELGVSGWRALREVSGLVARRQMETWKDWQPWLALLGLAGVAGVGLSRLVFGFGVALSFQARTYLHYGVMMNDSTPGEVIRSLICMLLVIGVWSWTSGFVLGLLSGRALWLTGPLFYQIVVQSFPAYLRYSGHLISRGSPSISLLMVIALLPLNILVVASFLLPAILGLRQGLRGRMPGLGTVLAMAAAVTWADIVYSRQYGLLLLMLASWPVGYVLTAVFRARSSLRRQQPE